MPSSSPARWLAPVALVGALVAVIVVASAGGGDSSGSGGGGNTVTAQRGAQTTRTTTTATTPAKTPRTYTVQPGDVLSAIAEKTGVPLEEIEQLNPDVDAQSLHAGQKLKLAP
jgi:LysM repeat protein